MTTIPQKVYDLVGTFMNIQADPVLGWPMTIIGWYDDIAAAMNADPSVARTDYSVSDVAQALTWLHQYGPEPWAFRATVPKVGPGRPVRQFVDANLNTIEFEGHVFMLVGANQPVDPEAWEVISTGIISWGRHTISSTDNDMTDLTLYASVLPNDAWGKSVIAAIAKVNRKKQDVIDAVEDLIKAL